jgi:hypothetical protein
MGTTRSGSPLLRAMIEDSTKEFYTASSREGRSTCSRRNHTRARESSCHSGHDNGSTAGAYTVVGHPPRPQ